MTLYFHLLFEKYKRVNFLQKYGPEPVIIYYISGLFISIKVKSNETDAVGVFNPLDLKSFF